MVPIYKDLAATSKIYLIQSVVSRLLVNAVFNAYFVGLPEERARQLEDVEQFLRSSSGVDNVNQWRSITLTILRKEPASLETSTIGVLDFIITQTNEIMDNMSDTKSTPTRDQSLRAMVVDAVDLARLLRVQRAVFTVSMPVVEDVQEIPFDASHMEDIGGEDEETLNERKIRCVTFPGIIKEGDENGEHTQLRNIIAKARVLCKPV